MSSPAKNQPHTPTLNSLLRQPSAITGPSPNATIAGGAGVSQQSGPALGTGGPSYGDSYSPGPMANVENSVQQQQQQQQQQQSQQNMYYNHQLGAKGSAPGSSYVPDGVHGVRYAPPTSASPFQQPQLPPHHQQPQQHAYYGGGSDKMYPSISSYPQPGIANGPSHSPRTAAPAAGQLHGQSKPNSTATNPAISRDHEPMVNGIPSLGKGATLSTGLGSSHCDPSGPAGPKHPSVTALRQEANAVSPAGTRNASPSPVTLPAPSSPASLMRHSPVSPTPVSVYNQGGAYHGPPSMSSHFGAVPSQQQQHPQQAPPGFYDGNYHYGGGYGHIPAGVQQGPPGSTYGSYQGSSSNFNNGPVAGPSTAAAPYYGQQQSFGGNPGSTLPAASAAHVSQSMANYAGSVTTSEAVPNQQNAYFGQTMKTEQIRSNDSRSINGPTNVYPSDASRVVPSPAVSDTTDAGKDPNRNGSGTPNIDSRHRTGTPAGGKSRVNGAKESHPSTPVPVSPGGTSAEDVDSSLSSPSWPRTPMSPAVRSQPSSMGPPPPVGTSSAQSTPGGSSKEGGANLVARLLGDQVQLGCSPQEWMERRAFYERLVHYCESNGHPITAQPTVSKQTVDLFRLYMAVRQRGGFEEVTRAKGWKEFCHLANLPYTSSASYQLRKHYVRYLLPYECHFDRGGIQAAVVMASVESKKKSAKQSPNKLQPSQPQQAAPPPPAKEQRPSLSHSSYREENEQSVHQPTRMQPFPQQSQQHQFQHQAQQYSNESFMGPPPVSYSGSVENIGAPPSVQPTASGSGGYPGHHGQPPPPQPAAGQYPSSGVPYMPGQHPRGMAPPQTNVGPHQQPPGGSEVINNRDSFDDRGNCAPSHAYYPPTGSTSLPAASPSTGSSLGAYGNQARPAPYTGATYSTQLSGTAPVSASSTEGNMRQHQLQQRETVSANDGPAPTSQGGYSISGSAPFPPQSSAPQMAPSASAVPNATAPVGGQSGYANIMATPSGSGYQTVPYAHDSGVNASLPPPNQYITPQVARYQGPIQPSAQNDVAPSPGMISQVYRSNVPPTVSYGPGTYGAPSQSATTSYTPQSQPSESSGSHGGNQMTSNTGQYNAPPPDACNTQPGVAYSWTSRYPHPSQPAGTHRFPPGAGYPPVANMPQSSADYSRVSRSGPAGYPRPNAVAYASGPPTIGAGYSGAPPNMSLRPDLGMKSLPVGAVQYSQPSTAHPPVHKKELSPVSTFPPGSVEATTFTLRRRRKLMAKDIGSVDAWRLVMALRSGLHAETSWALNSLNALLYDDNSALFFGLASLPGLLEILVEHWRRSLMDVLGDLLVIQEVKNISSREQRLDSVSGLTTEPALTSFASIDHCDETSSSLGVVESSLKRNCLPHTRANREKFSCQKTKNGEYVSVGLPDVVVDSVISYESGLWQRGGGASTKHLKCRMDGKCDEYSLPYACRQCERLCSCSKSDRQHPSKRKTDGEIDGEDCCVESSVPSKRRRLNSALYSKVKRSTTVATADSLAFFFGNRRYEECDEIEMHDNLPLQAVPVSSTLMVDRCLSISNVIRGLSFIPGNEAVMSKHAGLLRVLGELLLMCHKHVDRGAGSLLKNCMSENAAGEETNETKLDGNDDSTKLESSQTSVDMEDPLWFWDNLMTIVDDAFVVLCNLSTHLDLYELSEDVSWPLLDSLLHWAVCRSPIATDPLVPGAYVSPHRYAMEILCKLSVQERNVDLLLATPPWERIEFLLELLSSMLMLGEEIMMREFAVVLVHALCSASATACVGAALRTKTLQQLVVFLEHADASMHQIVQNHGMQALRDNPELIGTSVGMLRRAASSLLFMAKLPACHPKFSRYQQRLLHFTMSHLMDSRVAATVSETLYELQKGGEISVTSNVGTVKNCSDNSSSCTGTKNSPAAEADPVVVVNASKVEPDKTDDGSESNENREAAKDETENTAGETVIDRSPKGQKAELSNCCGEATTKLTDAAVAPQQSV